MLCGGSARVPGLVRLFQERVDIPVDIANPFARVEVASDFRNMDRIQELAPALGVAVGLGMRRLKEK